MLYREKSKVDRQASSVRIIIRADRDIIYSTLDMGSEHIYFSVSLVSNVDTKALSSEQHFGAFIGIEHVAPYY